MNIKNILQRNKTELVIYPVIHKLKKIHLSYGSPELPKKTREMKGICKQLFKAKYVGDWEGREKEVAIMYNNYLSELYEIIGQKHYGYNVWREIVIDINYQYNTNLLGFIVEAEFAINQFLLNSIESRFVRLPKETQDKMLEYYKDILNTVT